MRLKSIEYSEFADRPRAWYLDIAEFCQLNLLAGKNAVGKTRTLNIVNSLARLLSGTQRNLFSSGTWRATFLDPTDNFEHLYELSLQGREVVSERYIVDHKILLDRGKDREGKIWAEQLNDWMLFDSPPTELVAVTRRDKIQHSFFEKLNNWALSLSHFSFATNQERTTLVAMTTLMEEKPPLLERKEHAGFILSKALEDHEEEFKKLVFKDLAKLGYECEDIGLAVAEDVHGVGGPPPLNIFVKEKDLQDNTYQLHMSDGMFRTLSLLIRINYAVITGKHSCVLIDDIGEGLDFSRSKAFIPLLLDKAMKHGFQLIMTTNDIFVMNAVPLEYWSIVTRTGSHVSVVNRQNAPSIFEEYKFVGLSNFEFFASEFFKGQQKH